MDIDIVDILRRADVKMIVVNNTFRLAPDAWMLYGADAAWWHYNDGAIRFPGYRVTCSPGVPFVHRLMNGGGEGWTDERNTVHTYGNSGAQAIQIAVKSGASNVILCGFDMNGGHWHREHESPLRTTTALVYARWIDKMNVLAGYLRGRCRVINATPGSAITAFEHMPLQRALEAC